MIKHALSECEHSPTRLRALVTQADRCAPLVFNMESVKTNSDWLGTVCHNSFPMFIAMFLILVLIKLNVLLY